MRDARIDLPVESFFVRSADGLSIRAHRVGTGPICWLAGSKDVATPPSVMAALHRRTAGSRYVVIEAARTTGRSNIRRS
jgi:hypothetical protein